MKLLIIKNDGFGDFLIVKKLLKNLSKNSNDIIDLIISKNSRILTNDIYNLNHIFEFETLSDNFSNKKKISDQDKLQLKKIRAQHYDQCIVLRKFLNDEQILIMNNVNAIQKYSCFILKNDQINKLRERWENIDIPESNIHDFDYYKKFLIKLNLIKPTFRISTKFKQNHDKFLLINLSGERGFSNFNDLKFFFDTIFKIFQNNILIIGKSFDMNANKNIKKYFNENTKKFNNRIKNMYNKTNFKESISAINNCELYIGFDTGLSHYAATEGVKSLILLASGGGFRFWPYPNSFKINASYIVFNTPCSGCNYAGLNNKCFFDTKKCMDGMLNFKEKFIKYVQLFLIKKNNFFINFSDNFYFILNWNFYNSNISRICTINTNGIITFKKKNFVLLIHFTLKWIKFIFSNKLYKIYDLKLFTKNIISFFYSK